MGKGRRNTSKKRKEKERKGRSGKAAGQSVWGRKEKKGGVGLRRQMEEGGEEKCLFEILVFFVVVCIGCALFVFVDIHIHIYINNFYSKSNTTTRPSLNAAAI